MLLWILFILLTLLAVVLVAYPLMRGRKVDPSAAVSDADFDATIYREQLKEIERDLEEGLIGQAEAEAAKTEISRRLLAMTEVSGAGAARDTSDATGATQASVSTTSGRFAHWSLLGAVALGVPLFAFGVYSVLGRPDLPDLPHAARLQGPPDHQSIETLVARVEQRLKQNPDDGRGWDVLAPVYLRMGRHEDAAKAFRNAIRLLGESAERWAGVGEALVRGAKGVIDETARKAFQRALKLEPTLVTPHIRLAMADEQAGQYGHAVAAYRQLLENSPPDAPWRDFVEKRMREAEEKAKAAGQAITLPKDRQIQLSSGQGGGGAEARGAGGQQATAAMVKRMVASLEARLKKDGKDLEGWRLLLRSYVVMGRREDAQKALATARKTFADDPKALETLDALAKSLSL